MNSYSYSAISSARKCGKLFQYVYIDKLKPNVAISGDLVFGTGVHLGIESYLEGDDGTEDFITYWDIEKTRDNRYGRYGWSDLREQGIILLNKFKQYQLSKFEVYSMEQRLYATYNGIKLEGTPDVIGKYEGIESVLDFKTSGTRYHRDKIRTSEQLYLYSYLAQESLSYPVKQIVYLVLVKGSTPSIQVALKREFKQEECTRVLEDLAVECNRLNAMTEEKMFTRNLNSCIFGEKGECDMLRTCFPEEPKEKR